jgi:hypothetical protein
MLQNVFLKKGAAFSFSLQQKAQAYEQSNKIYFVYAINLHYQSRDQYLRYNKGTRHMGKIKKKTKLYVTVSVQ